jgi:hypothetical protein
LQWARNRAKFSSIITVTPELQAAIPRSVERKRHGFPPGGLRGPPSNSHRAGSLSSIDTGLFSPAGERKEGQGAIADASDAQEARIARFSAVVRPAWHKTSLGCPNTVLGCKSALRSNTLSSAAVGRMASSIH